MDKVAVVNIIANIKKRKKTTNKKTDRTCQGTYAKTQNTDF